MADVAKTLGGQGMKPGYRYKWLFFGVGGPGTATCLVVVLVIVVVVGLLLLLRLLRRLLLLLLLLLCLLRAGRVMQGPLRIARRLSQGLLLCKIVCTFACGDIWPLNSVNRKRYTILDMFVYIYKKSRILKDVVAEWSNAVD